MTRPTKKFSPSGGLYLNVLCPPADTGEQKQVELRVRHARPSLVECLGSTGSGLDSFRKEVADRLVRKDAFIGGPAFTLCGLLCCPWLSPDGRRLAYPSNESGQNEIYVRPFPGIGKGQRQVLKRFSNRPCTTWGGRGASAHTDAGGPMRASSMDRRARALLDSEAGMKAADVAAKYRVSGSWVRLLKQRRRDTGEVAPRVQRPGRRGMLEPHLHTLAALLAAHPDRTLAELKDALATPARVPTVWRAVRALGLTVKQNGPPVRARSA